MTDGIKYTCEQCKYETARNCDYVKHNATIKHMKSVETTSHIEKYQCKVCNYLTHRKSDYARHMISAKHLKPKHVCDICKREYRYNKKFRQHKALCADINPAPVSHVTINNINNTNNNNININVYLNNEYGNAINMTDFRNQLTLTLDDLIYTKINGYAKGISNILIKNLEAVGPSHRPIHCHNNKDSQFYVRDDDNWVEDSENSKIDMAIDSIASDQIGKIKEWEKENPLWFESHEGSKEYIDIVKGVIYGSSQDDQYKNKKLIRRTIRENIDLEVPVKDSQQI